MQGMRRRPLHASERAKEATDSGGTISEDNGEISDRPQQPQPVEKATAPPTHNPLAWVGVVFHLAMAVFYSLLLYHGQRVMNENQHILDPKGRIPVYGGRFKYLTHINQWVQLVFFDLQFVTELLPKSRMKCTLQKASDLLFTTVACPLSLFVALMFWGLYAVDRQLVYPEVFDKFVPPFLNHFWHTTIALWVVFEILLVIHRFPSTAVAASVVFLYCAGYISWVVWVYVKTGWWVYPVLKILPPYLMALFFGGGMFFALALHLTGKAVSYVRWGKTHYMDF